MVARERFLQTRSGSLGSQEVNTDVDNQTSIETTRSRMRYNRTVDRELADVQCAHSTPLRGHYVLQRRTTHAQLALVRRVFNSSHPGEQTDRSGMTFDIASTSSDEQIARTEDIVDSSFPGEQTDRPCVAFDIASTASDEPTIRTGGVGEDLQNSK